MDVRLLTLALPSAGVLAMLVWHSARSLPPWRALAFWTGAAAYGVARGVLLRVVTERGLGASFPYIVRKPLLTVFGVSFQEVAGWAIVAYLGWWLGWRFACTGSAPSAPKARARGRRAPEDLQPRLFVQLLWASLFLGAVSWAVEAAAGAAGWWSWTVPAGGRLLLGVPFIGLVDWFFVGIDFLLPFLVLTSDAWRARPLRWASLGAFPAHFASHAATGRLVEGIPIPIFHLVHWALLGGLLWAALRSRAVDAGFASAGGPADVRRPAAPALLRGRFSREAALARLPILGAGIVLADAAAVQALVVGRPELLPSIAPAATLVLASVVPVWGIAVSGLFGLTAFLAPPFLLATAPGGLAVLLRAGRSAGRGIAIAAAAGVAVAAMAVHAHAARREADLVSRLDRALAARNRGDLHGAEDALEAIAADHPESHAARGFLGEIEYRTNHLDRARAAFLEAVAIKRDFVMGHRYLAVIALEQGRGAEAAVHAHEGLEWSPDDLELLYVQERAEGGRGVESWTRASAKGADGVLALASLAAETNDAASAAEALDGALGRWPERRELYAARARIALAQGDGTTTARLASAWLARFPGDSEALALQRRSAAPQ